MKTNLYNRNFNRIMLSISRSSEFLLIRTFDFKHRWSRNFYVSCAALQRWLDSDHINAFMDHDMDSFLRIFYGSGDELTFELSWLHYSSGDFTGYRQAFYLSAQILRESLEMTSTYPMKILANTDKHLAQSRISFSTKAQEQIREMSPQQRNALRKALRHAFTWGRNTAITIFTDYGVDFLFREEGDHGLVGGFCFSKTTIIGSDHKHHAKFSYSIHT